MFIVLRDMPTFKIYAPITLIIDKISYCILRAIRHRIIVMMMIFLRRHEIYLNPLRFVLGLRNRSYIMTYQRFIYYNRVPFQSTDR